MLEIHLQPLHPMWDEPRKGPTTSSLRTKTKKPAATASQSHTKTPMVLRLYQEVDYHICSRSITVSPQHEQYYRAHASRVTRMSRGAPWSGFQSHLVRRTTERTLVGRHMRLCLAAMDVFA